MFDPESDFRRLPEPVGSTSPYLLEAAQQADPVAWEKLVDLYSPLIYMWSRVAGLQPEDAKDIVQSVLRSVCTKLEDFDTDPRKGAFRGWLRTITKNKLTDRFRREANRAPAAGGTEAQWNLAQVVDALSAVNQTGSNPGSDVSRLLDQVRGDFTESTWRAFWGMTVEQLSSVELGEELNMSAAAVRLAKSLVLQRLREVIADSGD